MGSPLMLSVETTPLPALIAGLEEAGIRVTPRELVPHPKYICSRGWVSFALSALPDSDSGALLVMFTCDLSRWRWWNFPVHWLASIPFAPSQVRLQRDAYTVLHSLGAQPIL